MSEEHLVVGRPPDPRRWAWWSGRGPGAVAALLALAGWAIWHGALDDGLATSRRAATSPTPSVPVETGLIAHDPPQLPYLRSGALVTPSGQVREIPHGAWNDFAVLTDEQGVLVEQDSVTVLGTDRQPRSYPLTGGLTARPDATAVAWTGPDGRVWRLDAGSTEPVAVPGARQLVPTCRGLRIDGRLQPGWRSCDRDGALIGPGGHYVASFDTNTVTIVPRSDLTGGVSTDLPGTVLDTVWEDPFHVLAAVRLEGETHLMRIGLGGETEDVIAVPGEDRTQPVLVLPLTGG
jgi:hypothetical protein